MQKVLVTGANGFVGKRVCSLLQREGYFVREAIRHQGRYRDTGVGECVNLSGETVHVGNIDGNTDWSLALDDIDTVVHLAARVHILQEVSKNPLEAFRMVNVFGTEHLARMAAQAGIRRFVYVSSISIHGNSTGDRPYVEEDVAQPHSPYAVSKWEGELTLQRIAKETGLELIVVRPPLVYGPGVGGNFLRLMRWADKGWPLPLGSVRNLRSFIGIDNFIDLIACCVSSPKAAGGTFLVADGEDISTPDLIRRIAQLLGRPARILPFPLGIFRTIGSIVKMNDVVERLCNSLQVSSEKARRVLGWSPKVSLDEGLSKTIDWYKNDHRKKGDPEKISSNETLI